MLILNIRLTREARYSLMCAPYMQALLHVRVTSSRALLHVGGAHASPCKAKKHQINPPDLLRCAGFSLVTGLFPYSHCSFVYPEMLASARMASLTGSQHETSLTGFQATPRSPKVGPTFYGPILVPCIPSKPDLP